MLKVTSIVMLLIILPLSIMSAWFYKRVSRSVKVKEEHYRVSNLRSIKENCDQILHDYEAALNSVYFYPEFNTYLQNENRGEKSDTKEKDLRYVLMRIRTSREYIGSAGLIFPDGSLLNSISGYGRFEEFTAAQERNLADDIRYIQQETPGVVWQVNSSLKKGRSGAARFISCRKNLRNIYNLEDLAALAVLNVSTHCLDDLSLLKHESEDELLLILDKENQIVWKTPESGIHIDADEEDVFSEIRSKEKRKIHDLKYGEEAFCFLYDESDYSSWLFIKIVPKAAVYEQVTLFNSYFFIVLMFIFFFAAISIMLLNSLVVRPIREMIVTMDHIDEIEKINISKNSLRNDEIGGLYRSFDRMNERIDSLIIELKEAYTADKEKEIKLIQSQLNPHFIYNTLECISCVAYERELPEVSQALNSLSSILRYSIKHSGEYVTFREELNQLEQYIFIQHFRFEDSFSVHFSVDESLLDYKTIKFTFQPFVENALLYAFDGSSDDCRIDVSLKDDGEDVLIEITDNGVGMSDEKIKAIVNYDSKGLGIKSIDKALRLRFGPAYHLIIESKEHEGTTVQIRVPKIE